MSGIEILLSSRHGVYIPQIFSEDFKEWGVTDDDKQILSDPSSDWYWDAWDSVLITAKHTDSKGNVWRLYQDGDLDGDLFAVCDELMSDDEYEQFYGEKRND